ncbi:acetate--CoA ligase family protein [Nocardioides sp. CFH 31398]|uniref:acetate--CoA ligase family protein n=1 Tax=Nocardioides sp. CFH 31398 TaxID=2919579 RepID=UPI001F05F17C|nr:acetate--CoA ligase family protein [Nocardioides sp. CFH 31398]MCH1865468.1 acetate--CoA ligase family protein [Nocardioides sp. CFH 31398]
MRRPRDLTPLLDPRAVLLVGASSDHAKLGGAMAASLASYDRPVALVNARGGEGMHTDVAAAAAALDATPDLAVLCVPAPACPDVLEECAAVGVRAALVCAGGFAELGGEGAEAGAALQSRLAGVAARHDLAVLGPNTSGFVVPALDLRASFVPGVARVADGAVAVVAASGGLNHALMFALERAGQGVSLGVGVGAGTSVDAVDLLAHAATDPRTRAVALHLETVPDGVALLDAVRTTTATTPVVALVVGEHDLGDFATSHTGALATSWRTTRALLEQAGAVVVDDEEQLVAAASTLAATRLTPHPDPGVGLVTAQAGPGLLVTDALLGAGVRVPELGGAARDRLAGLLPPMTHLGNPVDTGRPGPRHGEVLTAVAADPGVDLVAVYALAEPVVDLPASVAAADLGDAAVVVGLDGSADEVGIGRRDAAKRGLACQVGARGLVSGLVGLVADARTRHRGLDDVVAGTGWVGATDGAWDEARAKDLLDALGVPTPARAVVTEADARGAIRALGGPAVLKVCDPAVAHKTDVGGVVVGVTEATLDDALARVRPLGAERLIVEELVPDGLDLVVGARRDPVFGPVVLVGVGGVATEVHADVALAGVPATRAQLTALPGRLRARALLAGHRGGPVVDVDALADLLADLGRLLLDHPGLEEVEINPLRVTPGDGAAGWVALDALVVPTTTRPTTRATTRPTDQED